MFVIRDAKPKDARGIQEVFYRTWLATYPNQKHGITLDDIEQRYIGYDSPERIDRAAKRITDLPANERFWVAEDSGEIVGVCHIVIEPDKNFLRAIYVLPQYQGQGIGSALMRRADGFFKPLVPSRVTVATYNDRAIRFYEGLGFKKTDRVIVDEKFRMKSGSIITEIEMIRPPKA
ncbi:MAG: GNAT family N-acetyltransferase [Patescibacteria group bacterium]|nr:GNAT family N-acetyltransferase [Patescibacteria group bacterium]MDE2116785.1 GNAT family N-acetyltransferase [Patescibacteria group bacterium]